ncbi:MAG: transcriptional regulator [Candidatus Chloroheliales bacterium]|nr:MAG: transcriptional regulator [Chloroflexota bacterium]
MDDEQRRAELALFLRTRRARLSPRQVGLPAVGRRRTPGLRREEVAEVAGVGVSWYTWLEQGRAITVSASVLDSVARALQLDASERNHLFILAREEVPAAPTPLTFSVDLAVKQILDSLEIYPAYVTNARWDVVAWNQAACRIFADFTTLSTRDRNLLWFMFKHPLARQLYVDWEATAQQTLALFRASTGRYISETWFTELVVTLSCASPEFAAWWSHNEVHGTPETDKEINHPKLGYLALQPTILPLAQTPDLCMMIYTTAPGTNTEAKLQCLRSAVGDSYQPAEERVFIHRSADLSRPSVLLNLII